MSLISDGESTSRLGKTVVLYRFQTHDLARTHPGDTDSALAIIYPVSNHPLYDQHLAILRVAKSVSASVATILRMKQTRKWLAILCGDGVTLAEQLETDIEENGLGPMPLEDALSMADEMLKVVCELHKGGIYGLTLLPQAILISGGNPFFQLLDFSQAKQFQPDESQRPLSEKQRIWVKDIHHLGTLLLSLSLKEVKPRNFDGVAETEMKEIVKRETEEIGEIWGEFLIMFLRDQPRSAVRLYEELKNRIFPSLNEPKIVPGVIDQPRPDLSIEGRSKDFPRERYRNPFPSPDSVKPASSFPQLSSLLFAAKEWVAHGQLSFAERKLATFLRTINTLPSIEIRVSLNLVDFSCGICSRKTQKKAEIWTLVCLHYVCTECLKKAVEDTEAKYTCFICGEAMEVQEQELERMDSNLRRNYTVYSWKLL